MKDEARHKAMLDRQRAANKRWRLRHPKGAMPYYRMQKFGLSPKQHEAMLARQSGLCAICGKPETVMRNGVVKALAVDHDKETGKVRALLCQHCNTSLGMFKDSKALLLRAVEYLESFSRKTPIKQGRPPSQHLPTICGNST